MTEIPEDILAAAKATTGGWMTAGLPEGNAALVEAVARAILAERERVMALLAAGAPHSPRRYIYDDKPDRRIWACQLLDQSIRNPLPTESSK